MIYLKDKIISEYHSGNLWIDDFKEEKVGPNSYDLHLDNQLMFYGVTGMGYLDCRQDNQLWPYEKRPTESVFQENCVYGWHLKPGVIYLGQTKEYTETRGAIPCIEGKSSIGRLGISIHATAGFGDIGFCGKWTLEISCVQPVIIYPDMPICQIYYMEPSTKMTREFVKNFGYTGKYQNQREVQRSMMFKNWNEETKSWN